MAYSDVEHPITYIPNLLIEQFESISAKNRSIFDSQHNETLALLIGQKCHKGNKVTGLLYPDQNGHAYHVDSKETCCGNEIPVEIENKFGLDKEVLGWIHTHCRDIKCFFSSLDIHTQYGYQRLSSDFIGIVCKLSANDSIIETQVYKLTQDGMKNVEDCISKHGGTLVKQHDFCTKDPGVLYETLKSEVSFVNDEIDFHMSESFVHEEINKGMKTNPSTAFTGKKRSEQNYLNFSGAKKVKTNWK